MDEYYIWSHKIIKILNFLLIIISILALVSLILNYGFYISKDINELIIKFNIFVIQFYLFQFILKFSCSIQKFNYLKSHWFESLLSIAIIAETLWIIRKTDFKIIEDLILNVYITEITKIYIVISQIIIILTFLPGIIHYNQKISNFKIHPSQFFILSFIVVITIGTLLLCLPKAVTPGNKINFIDALFTATSAVCVTGLIVVDTATFFSPLGKIIILILIQIGGLGLMTLTSFFALFFGKGVGIKERVMLNEMLNTENIGVIKSTLKQIILTAFSIEIVGAILLFFFWKDNGWDLKKLLFNSIFHSISAFCNAGFSSFSNNLMGFKSHLPTIFVITTLIIIGGLGFPVLNDLSGLIKKTFIKTKKNKLKVHTKIVLITTFILILVGTISFILFEERTKYNNNIELFATAYFTSVTARTAGFNTIDIASLSVPMTLILIFLMYIGASPGSTGGGIKTTTFSMIWIGIFSMLTGKRRIVLYKKNIPFVVFNRAIIVVVFSLTIVAIFTILLCSIEKERTLIDIVFELFSALGTVGLSRGITSSLSFLSKSVLIFTMLIGRVGILSLTFAITTQKQQTVFIEYPQEMVNIG